MIVYTFYCIIPKDDGYHTLAIKENGEYYLLPKEDNLSEGKELVFHSAEEAQEYINKNLDDSYHPEAFWRTDRFVCPACGGALKKQHIVGSDSSVSGYVEHLCSCRNKNCALDWICYTDAEDNEVEIKRYFIGW